MNQQERDEICRRGQELYEQTIRANVEVENKGRYLVLNVETGDYAIGDEYLNLSHEVRARNPDGYLFGLRIGYPTLARIGYGVAAMS